MASYGFGHWIYSVVPTFHALGDNDVTRISSYPQGFVDDYNTSGFAEIDPSTQYWISRTQATSYRKVRCSVNLSARQKQLMTLNWDHDVNRGIVIPLSNVLGFKAVLALSFEGSYKELDACVSNAQKQLFKGVRAFNRNFLLRHKTYFLDVETPCLTAQQIRVLTLMAQGFLTKQMADALSISVNGVDKHIANIKSALRAKTSSEATALAVQWELV